MSKQVLSASEIAALKEESKEISATLNAANEHNGSNKIDKGALKRQQAHIDRLIHEGSAPKLSGKEKDKLYARAKELESKIKQGMPTRDQMWAKRGEHPGIVRHQRQWEARNARDIQEWKQIQRALEPGDPTASSIERLRRR